MSCNCKNTDGFKAALIRAKNIDGVVFVVDFQGEKRATFGSIKAAKDSGACCYFTPDGKEVKITRAPKKKQTKKVD